MILFLHTWNDLRWMQSFKNQKKFKTLHCAGIHTPTPTNHFLQIHCFKGEGCLPLWMSASQRQPARIPPWICCSYKYVLSACRSFAFIVTPLLNSCRSLLTKHSPPSGWRLVKKNLQSFLFQNYKENTCVIRAKIVISFSFLEQFSVDTIHLSSCLLS